MIRSWLRTHQKKVVIHSLILGSFLLYMVFLAGPLLDRFEGIPGKARLLQLTLPPVTGNIRYAMDLFYGGTRQIEVNGWAFIKGYSSENTSVYLILKSQKNTYGFETVSRRRPDITIVFKELGLNLNGSGFYCLVPLRELKPGEYTAGLYITKGDIQALQYTDKKFVR